MKKRNLMLLSALAAVSILMTGCGFTADDPADSQAVTITPEPVAATATPAPTSTPTPTVTPAAALTTTPAPGTATNGDTATADGTAAGTTTSTDGTASTDTSTSTGSDSSSASSTSSGDATAYVGSTLSDFMSVYGSPIEYEPAYDANGNEVGGVYSFNDFSITTDFMSGSETVEAVDYY